ncbi:Serine O-acetyltransferase [Novosphingobium nitrogenifigens DSM 19370]|uniref:serine O-acetyltransferase n=1 Tax=Novosphingobium nitrogenifigens DSM 19370 TaxID=983920 RepID=F1ZDI4_9SPHN|nr:serine O-acetyltransferase EpsC [Novosphingobium nitrogenifigens]EGD57275.1 Serine O-acetyltransferase [Novosphingobium nitrogenifigens DSM 19370]
MTEQHSAAPHTDVTAPDTRDSVIPAPSTVDTVIDELRAVRMEWRSIRDRHAEFGALGFPSRQAITRIIDILSAALFPLRLGPPDLTIEREDAFVEASLASALPLLASQVRMELHYSRPERGGVAIERAVTAIVEELLSRLPAIRRLLDTDLEAAYDGDPAARSVDEVLLCYPCVTAVIHHRIAHELYRLGVPLIARIIAEIAHSRTGIDIHPGATIGESFFIDHGTGVVIGQTAILGSRVRIYQAVTLGARSFSTDADGRLVKDEPRHPIIEDDVTIYAGATILGRITIGQGSVVGGNVWLTRSVPPGSRVRQTQPSVSIEATDPCD